MEGTGEFWKGIKKVLVEEGANTVLVLIDKKYFCKLILFIDHLLRFPIHNISPLIPFYYSTAPPNLSYNAYKKMENRVAKAKPRSSNDYIKRLQKIVY
jgi:hypothetical protein